MQPWELTSIPREWVPLFNSADEVWTPSTFCRDVYVRAGVHPGRVQVIPNGIDPEVFSPAGPKLDLPTRKRCKLLYVGGTIARKGFDVLARAYGAAFTAGDDVCLVVKDMGTDSFYRHQHGQELVRCFAAVEGAPELHYRDAPLLDDEVGALYRACDALVAPYRGEGFALPVLEAMACGLPVIVTRGGATDDFVDETVGRRIAARSRAVGDRAAGLALVEPAMVLEPDHDDLVSALRWVVAYPAEAAARGKVGSRRAHADWTWQHATDRVLARIAALGGTTPPTPRTA
jgi:glycosyltransferase involved in cell wall biosynthesis